MQRVTAGNRLITPQDIDKPVTMSAVLRKQSNELQMHMDKSIYYNIYFRNNVNCQTFGD